MSSNYASDNWLATFPQDANNFVAWETFTASNDYTLFTVGNQPSDLPDYKTAEAKADAVIASGKPAGILFRRGGSFTINDAIQTNGISAQLPFVVGSTFDLPNPRPIITNQLSIGNARQATKNIAVFGLDLYDPIHDPSSALFNPTIAPYPGIWMNSTVAGGQNVWIEDISCRFNGGITLQDNADYFKTLILRNCQICNCWQYKAGGPSMGGGVYAHAIQDLLIENNLLDHSGWLPPTATWAGWPANIYWHNLYLQVWDRDPAVDPQTRVLNNLIARAAATGFEQRSGGLNDGNLILGNPIAGYVGPGGANPTISNYLVDGGGGEFTLSSGPSNPRGWGVFLNYLPTQGTIGNGLCINKSDSINNGFAVSVQCNSTPPVATSAMINSCTVHGWTGAALAVAGNPASLTFAGNNDLGIPTVAPTRTYVDSTRTTASYAKTLGITAVINAATFLAAAANNRRGNWDSRLTASAAIAYVNAGFQVKS